MLISYDRTTFFGFGGPSDWQRGHIGWVFKASLGQYVAPAGIVTGEAATIRTAKLKNPLQITQHHVGAFEAGFEIAAKPTDAGAVEAMLSDPLNDLEPQLTLDDYDARRLVDQFDAKPPAIRQPLQGDLHPGQSRELSDKMGAAALPP